MVGGEVCSLHREGEHHERYLKPVKMYCTARVHFTRCNVAGGHSAQCCLCVLYIWRFGLYSLYVFMETIFGLLPGLDIKCFVYQPLWLVVFQSYLPLSIFTSHTVVVGK